MFGTQTISPRLRYTEQYVIKKNEREKKKKEKALKINGKCENSPWPLV